MFSRSGISQYQAPFLLISRLDKIYIYYRLPPVVRAGYIIDNKRDMDARFHTSHAVYIVFTFSTRNWSDLAERDNEMRPQMCGALQQLCQGIVRPREQEVGPELPAMREKVGHLHRTSFREGNVYIESEVNFWGRNTAMGTMVVKCYVLFLVYLYQRKR